MSYRPFRSFSRFLLAACAVSLGAMSLSAQTTCCCPSGNNPSRVDVFMGYSYFGAHGQLKPQDINYSSIDVGAIGSGAYYFNKYVGGEFIFIANHPTARTTVHTACLPGRSSALRWRTSPSLRTAGAGAANLGGPNSDNPATFGHNPYQWGPSADGWRRHGL